MESENLQDFHATSNPTQIHLKVVTEVDTQYDDTMDSKVEGGRGESMA